MSRINDLISKLCPEGVEFSRLGEFALLSNTGVDKKLVTGESEVYLLNYLDICRNNKISSQTLSAITTASPKKIADCNLLEGDILITPSSETRGDLANAAEIVSDIPNAVYSYHVMRIRLNDFRRVNPTFIVHLFGSQMIQDQVIRLSTGMTRYGLTKPKWESLIFPIPPLAIQEEIVRILEKFTELEAELERELEARKSQYQHFRHKLLQCEGQDYREIELGMFGRVLMCKRIMKDETANFGDVPFYKIGTFGGKPDAYITQAKFDEFRTKYPFPKVGALLISAAGTIGKIVKYRGEPSYFQDSNIVWLDHDESVVLNDYLFHCYKTAKWSTDTGSIPRLYNSNILKLKIKVPSLQEQRRVADFLGLFEMLTNDGVAGIPTEMAARRQQYEYYRNKLLTLKASGVT